MRATRLKALWLSLLSLPPLHASTTSTLRTAASQTVSVVKTQAVEGEALLSYESLRIDVAHHPDSYVAFETEIGAHRFFAEHPDVLRETDRGMVQRGILGYWRGRTVALVPSLLRRSHFGIVH